MSTIAPHSMLITPLSKSALAVFHVLTEGIRKVGDHRRIDNCGPNSGIMPVVIEGVGPCPQGAAGRCPHGALIVSVAHYYQQNGDLMADPEVTFLAVFDHEGRPGEYVFPLSFKQAGLGIDREYIHFEDGKVFGNVRMQNDLAGFCTMWMRNIKQQQFGGKLPKTVTT